MLLAVARDLSSTAVPKASTNDASARSSIASIATRSGVVTLPAVDSARSSVTWKAPGVMLRNPVSRNGTEDEPGGEPDSLFVVWILPSIAGALLNGVGNTSVSQLVESRRFAKLVVE